MRRFLGIGKPKVPSVAGEIACYGLAEWWLNAFSDQDRALVRRTFKPLGSLPSYAIDKGESKGCNRSDAAGFLGGLASWFKDRKYDRVQFTILSEAERRSCSTLDRHFVYSSFVEYWYRLRDEREEARDNTIQYCERQIDLSKDAANAWRKAHGPPLPSHVGFKQLTIIREKDGNYANAIQLCQQAKKDGWAGDWDKRIARLEGKLAKAAKLGSG